MTITVYYVTTGLRKNGVSTDDLKFKLEKIQIDKYGYHFQWQLSFKKSNQLFGSYSYIGQYDVYDHSNLRHLVDEFLLKNEYSLYSLSVL